MCKTRYLLGCQVSAPVNMPHICTCICTWRKVANIFKYNAYSLNDLRHIFSWICWFVKFFHINLIMTRIMSKKKLCNSVQSFKCTFILAIRFYLCKRSRFKNKSCLRNVFAPWVPYMYLYMYRHVTCHDLWNTNKSPLSYIKRYHLRYVL